jgi:hypothetical protein
VYQDALAAQGQLAQELERATRELAYVQVGRTGAHGLLHYETTLPYLSKPKPARNAQKHQPEALQGPQAAAFREQLTNAQRVHAARAVTLSQLQDVLALAQQAADTGPAGHMDDDDDEC